MEILPFLATEFHKTGGVSRVRVCWRFIPYRTVGARQISFRPLQAVSTLTNGRRESIIASTRATLFTLHTNSRIRPNSMPCPIRFVRREMYRDSDVTNCSELSTQWQ